MVESLDDALLEPLHDAAPDTSNVSQAAKGRAAIEAADKARAAVGNEGSPSIIDFNYYDMLAAEAESESKPEDP